SSAQPPTPSATPTSATAPTFDFSTFNTPKSSGANFDSQFSWNISPLAGHFGSYDQTSGEPKDASFVNLSTPIQRSESSSNQKRARPVQGVNFAEYIPDSQHLSVPDYPLFPTEEAGQYNQSPALSSTHAPNSNSKSGLTGQSSKSDASSNSAYGTRSAGSMQTPPPTSSSAGKRKKRKPTTGPSKGTTNATRKMSLPISDLRSQQLLSRSQASTTERAGSFDLQAIAPAAAPIFPPQNLIWGPDSHPARIDLNGTDHNLLRADNGVRLENQTSFDWSQWQDQGLQSSGPSMNGFAALHVPSNEYQGHNEASYAAGFNHAQATNGSSFSQYASTSSQPQPSSNLASGVERAVDPNLLFSFSNIPSNITPDTASFTHSSFTRRRNSSKPYQHQQEELQRENEARRALKKQSQPSSKCGIDVTNGTQKSAPRPGLKRSVTDGSLGRKKPLKIRQSQVTFVKPAVQTSLQNKEFLHEMPPNIVSHKNDMAASRAVTEPQSLTTVNFAIDTNGRALVETRSIRDGSGKRQAPSPRVLVDESSSGSESDSSNVTESMAVPSYNSSFALPHTQPTEPKHAHFDESLSTLDYRRFSQSNMHVHGLHAIGSSQIEPESEAETIMDDSDSRGDAYLALKKVLRRRQGWNRTYNVGNL
ncbi:MAG: hypothetical protein M1837_004423, partial [Sclerophora amabilis]